jgi:hypothetical protein
VQHSSNGPTDINQPAATTLFLKKNKYYCIFPPCTGSDEINPKLTWVSPPPTCMNAAHHNLLRPPHGASTINFDLQPLHAASTTGSDHYRSEHHRSHAPIASPITLVVVVQTRTQPPQTPSVAPAWGLMRPSD